MYQSGPNVFISKRYISVLFFFHVAFFITAQSWESDIVKKLSLHQAVNHNEKIFVQTDRPAYLPGETVWFSAFVMNAASQKLNLTEVVLHVELLKPDQSISSKDMFKIEEGKVSGQIDLRYGVKPGKYYLVAYTNWMRNAGSAYYFSKEIIIVGSRSNVSADSNVLSSSVMDDGSQVELEKTESKFNIKFYPEGGELIAGVNTKVAFEVVDELGLPIDFMGMVEDETGQIVAAAKTLWRGKGFFMLNPQPGKKYFIRQTGEIETLNKEPLPEALTSGLTMAVTDKGKNKPVQIMISRIGALTSDSTAFLLATQNGQPKNAMKIDLTERESVAVLLEKTEFNNGIVQLTLFDCNKLPKAERLLFVKKDDALNIALREVKLPASGRDAVEMELQVTNADGLPVEGNFTVSATDAERVPDQSYQSPNIMQYLSLYSDLPDLKVNESVLFEDSGEGNFKSELLMLTNGWRRYKWEEVITDTIAIPEYLEEPGIYVKGKVRSLWGKDKVPEGAEVTMVAGSVFDSYNEKVNKNGEFTFIMSDFYDSKRVVVQTKNKKDAKRDYKIDIQTSYQPQPADQFSYLTNAYCSDSNAETINIEDIRLTRDLLEKELARVVIEDTFVVTTDVAIDEVDVKAESKKSAKGIMNQKYGAPDYSVGETKIGELMGEMPWYDGIFSLLYEAFPELRITTSNVGVDGSSVELTSNGMEIVEYSSTTTVSFQLIGKRRHRFFVYVDGKMVGASNTKGIMSGMLGTYSIDDLVTLDPMEVKSVDLVFPDTPNAKALLTGDAEFFNNEDIDWTTLEGQIEYTVKGTEEVSTPVAILSIYTQAGGGLYSTIAYKGISNVTLHGFKRVKEFYHFDYSTSIKDSILSDERNTLAWFPDVETDINGKAPLKFYASDVSNKIRLEINGVSDKGEVGSLLYYTPDSLFTSQQTLEPKRELINQQPFDPLYKAHLFLPDRTPVSYAKISTDQNDWSAFTSADGLFPVEENIIHPTSTIKIEKAGFKSLKCTYQDLLDTDKTLEKEEIIHSSDDALEIIKKLYRSRFKNRNSKKIYFKGAYREKIFDNTYLHSLKDLGFIQMWPNMAEEAIPIETNITGRQEYHSIDYSRKINFTPLKRNDVIPQLDPVWFLESFLDLNFQKAYEYILVGETQFQGRRMYRIHFDQYNDVNYAFYQGELLIDAETYGLAWASWRFSDKAKKYIMPDMYLVSARSSENFEVVREQREMTWKFNGETWDPDFSIYNVSFYRNGELKKIEQETVWKPISQDEFKVFKDKLPKKWNQINETKKEVEYSPAQWRNNQLLPPDLSIINQIKFLNEVTRFVEETK
nr:MG2 domain-containing protein [uncultured Carboxylicivirga sp.]